MHLKMLLLHRKEQLKVVSDQHKDEDVHNLDETALFYKLGLNKTLTFKRKECSGGKHSKEWITVPSHIYSIGMSKLEPLATGKHKVPGFLKTYKACCVIITTIQKPR